MRNNTLGIRVKVFCKTARTSEIITKYVQLSNKTVELKTYFEFSEKCQSECYEGFKGVFKCSPIHLIRTSRNDSGIVKKCAVGEYPKSRIGRSQAA